MSVPLVSVHTIRVSAIGVSLAADVQRSKSDLVVFDIHHPLLSSSRAACDLVGLPTRHIFVVPPVGRLDKHTLQRASKQQKQERVP